MRQYNVHSVLHLVLPQSSVYLIFIFCANELKTRTPREVLELTR